VQASLPGASPEIMASSVATPLERQFGRIAGITEMSSSSYLGQHLHHLAVRLEPQYRWRRQGRAGRHQRRAQLLPANLPSNPTYQKVNPADSPIFVIASHVQDLRSRALYDAASTSCSRSCPRFPAWGRCSSAGVRSRRSRRYQSHAIEQLWARPAGCEEYAEPAECERAEGPDLGRHTTADILANDQLLKADYYKPLIVGYHNGAAIKLSDIADVQDSVENIRTAGFFNGKPCVTLQIFRQPNANIIETNQRIRRRFRR
jgi:multidrug efflux pump